MQGKLFVEQCKDIHIRRNDRCTWMASKSIVTKQEKDLSVLGDRSMDIFSICRGGLNKGNKMLC